MARTGRPKAVLTLSEDEGVTLARWARRPSSPQSLALRSRIVLACANGATNQSVAADLGVSVATVGKWRSRFVEKRLTGLADEYRSGAPHTVLDEHVEAVIVKTLTEKPFKCHPLVDEGHGEVARDVTANGGPDLEGVRSVVR